MSITIPAEMIKTSEAYIYPQRKLFREMVQVYDGLILRKTLEAIKKAKFKTDPTPFFDTHDAISLNLIGDVRNLTLDLDGIQGWRGDVYFQKDKLSEDQKIALLTGQKRDLSIGFEYTLVTTPEDPGVYGDQTEIVVDHIAWVDQGRCTLPYCGLDKDEIASMNMLQDQGQLKLSKTFKTKFKCKDHIQFLSDSEIMYSKNNSNKEMVKIMANDSNTGNGTCGCDAKAKDSRIKELEAQLKTIDAGEKENLTAKIKELSDKIAAFQTEKEALTKQLAEMKDTSDAQKASLEKYQKIERDALVKEITEKSEYKAEELKDLALDTLNERLDIIKKAKTDITRGYPAGDSGSGSGSGGKEKAMSSIDGTTNLMSLLPKVTVENSTSPPQTQTQS